MDSSSFSLTNVVASAIGFFTLWGTIFFLFYRKFSFHQENKTTASSSMPLSSPPSNLSRRNLIHHVFPSFHGADVRKAFLSHVLKEFRSKGIDPFIDNDIVRSKSIGPELIEAIKGSRISIVLLSRNYASSTWCLDELVEIIKCREELGQTVMSLFYQVDPTDVKKQTRVGMSSGKLVKVRQRTTLEGGNMLCRKWPKSPVIIQTTGICVALFLWDNEAEMIEKIASDVSNKLNNSTLSSDFDGLVGMRSHIINMESLLRLDLEEVRIIGILGPPGIGKTTIARFLFNRYSHNFQLSIFMENIKTRYTASSDDYSAKLYLQKQFMSQIINQMDIKIPHLGIAKDRLKDKKVIVVLDGVDRLVQLEAMANETRWFGPCSRIIITTQDQKLLRAHGINHIYKVDFPSNQEALQMFCMYAFCQKSPKDGFTELAWKVTRLAGKVPLGLRVMGSYFRGMSKPEWTMALPRLKTSLNGEIEGILKLSYDALYDEDKNLFLHIACFFNGEPVDIVEEHLASSFLDLTHGLHVLAEKSLIYMDSGMIEMHELLVQLGRESVRKQSINEPGKRQFLVEARDIVEVLNDDKAGSSSIVGIDNTVSTGDEDIKITTERVFEKLSNLQFLRINGDRINMDFLGNLNSISRKLRFLSWINFQMPSLPSNFYPKFLVSLDMPWSKLEKLWKGIQPLSNLRWMILSSSENLKELPDLSTATNLCQLDLHNCSSLVEIPSSIGHATHLQELNLSYCTRLVKLPFSIGDAINLQKLCLCHCYSLVEIPSSIGNASNLQKLDLSHCSSLVALPSSILNLRRLSLLDLRECSNFESLEVLDISESFHETSTNIEDLKPSGPTIEEVPSSTRSYFEIQENVPWTGRISRLFCSFRNPYICLSFIYCFKLNQEARDLIIHTPTNGYAVLPGGEVPKCFTYRAYGSSLTVKLNQKPLHTSIKFKACILFDYDDFEAFFGFEVDVHAYPSIASKQNALTSCKSNREIGKISRGHLYIFKVEVEEVTSTKLDFEFKLCSRASQEEWEIKECGVFQLGDGDEDNETSDREASKE